MLNRPTSLRDPANPSGGVNIPYDNRNQTNPIAAGTGSSFFSANVAGAWQVINAKGAISAGGPYANEQLASNAAATANGQTAPKLEID
jgi:hypothetical protein